MAHSGAPPRALSDVRTTAGLRRRGTHLATRCADGAGAFYATLTVVCEGARRGDLLEDDNMDLSRRRMLQLGGLGVVAVGGLRVPFSAGCGRLGQPAGPAAAPAPVPSAVRFAARVRAGRDGRGRVRQVRHVRHQRAAGHCSGAALGPASGRLRLRGKRPGPDHPRRARHSRGGEGAQPAAGGPPPLRVPVPDVDAPARQPVASGVRRLRQRRHSAGQQQGLPVAQREHECSDAVVPRPRRAPHGRERLLRVGRTVPGPRPCRTGAAPDAVAFRRPTDRCRCDVRGERRPGVRRLEANRACGATSSWSTACPGPCCRCNGGSTASGC